MAIPLQLFRYSVLMVLFFGIAVPAYPGATDGSDLIAKLRYRFQSLTGYSATIITQADGSTTQIQYRFKKPGFITMEFVEPHKGAVLTYSPETEKVTLKPFSSLPFFSLALKPDNSLITSPGGHTVDRSDMGNLIDNLILLSEKGDVRLLPESESGTEKLIKLEIRGEPGASVDGVHMYQIGVDRGLMFPVEVKAYDINGTQVEFMTVNNLTITE